MKTIYYRWYISVLLYFSLMATIIGQSANLDSVLPPGFNPNYGKQAPLRRTPEHSLVRRLSSLFKEYVEKTSRTPTSWEELEQVFGKSVWESRDQWSNIKRRFAFVATEGQIDAKEQGLVVGTLLLAPLYSIRDARSEEEGRFAVWRMSNGWIFEMWSTESELQTFSKWGEVTVKLETAKAAAAQMPPLVIKSTPIPQPSRGTVKPAPTSSPVPALTPASQEVRQQNSVQTLSLISGIAVVIAIGILLQRRRSP